jgi:hypothetical protein
MDLLDNPFYYVRPYSYLAPKNGGGVAGILDLPKRIISRLKYDIFDGLDYELYWLPEMDTDKAYAVTDRIAELIKKKWIMNLGEAKILTKDMKPLAKVNFYATVLRRFENIEIDLTRSAFQNILLNYDKINFKELFTFIDNKRKERQGGRKLAEIDEYQVKSELETHERYYASVILEKLDRMQSREIIREINIMVEFFRSEFLVNTALLSKIIHKYLKQAKKYMEKENDSLIILSKELKLQLEHKVDDENIKIITDKIREIMRNLEPMNNILNKFYEKNVKIQNVEAYAQIYTAAQVSSDKYAKYDFAISLLWGLSNMSFGDSFAPLECLEKLRETIVLRDIIGGGSDSKYSLRFKKFKKRITRFSEDILTIDDEGLIWKGNQIEFSKISDLTWGKQNQNEKIPGAMFKNSFVVMIKTSENAEIILGLKNVDYFNFIVNRLWNETAGRLTSKILNDLNLGKSYQIGDVIISNDNITTGKGAVNTYEWSKLIIKSENNMLDIRKSESGDFIATINFLDSLNLPALGKIIELAKRFRLEKLSDLSNVKKPSAQILK